MSLIKESETNPHDNYLSGNRRGAQIWSVWRMWQLFAIKLADAFYYSCYGKRPCNRPGGTQKRTLKMRSAFTIFCAVPTEITD